MSGRRLIGIDLAWSEGKEGKPNASGCAELVWDGEELELTRVDLIRSIDNIVTWIDPERDDWVVAVDGPLVIRNETGQRIADKQASTLYSQPYQAGAHTANLNRFGRDHRGGQLLKRLKKRHGTLVEEFAVLKKLKKQKKRRLVFETYPHIAMVELFGLNRTIKYKTSWIDRNCKKEDKIDCQIAGQQQLVDCIRDHLCSNGANPLLRPNKKLNQLLAEPATDLTSTDLKAREDKLDAVVCAYMAAWLDKGRPVRGLGEVCEGVMITPHLLGVGLPLG